MNDEILDQIVQCNGDPICCHLWMQRHVRDVEQPNMGNVKVDDE